MRLVNAASNRPVYWEAREKSRADDQHREQKDEFLHGEILSEALSFTLIDVYTSNWGTKNYASVAAFVTWATVASIRFQPEGPSIFRKRRSAACQCGSAAAI